MAGLILQREVLLLFVAFLCGDSHCVGCCFQIFYCDIQILLKHLLWFKLDYYWPLTDAEILVKIG